MTLLIKQPKTVLARLEPLLSKEFLVPTTAVVSSKYLLGSRLYCLEAGRLLSYMKENNFVFTVLPDNVSISFTKRSVFFNDHTKVDYENSLRKELRYVTHVSSESGTCSCVDPFFLMYLGISPDTLKVTESLLSANCPYCTSSFYNKKRCN